MHQGDARGTDPLQHRIAVREPGIELGPGNRLKRQTRQRDNLQHLSLAGQDRVVINLGEVGQVNPRRGFTLRRPVTGNRHWRLADRNS